jgi:D-alanine-D-alanine ligase
MKRVAVLMGGWSAEREVSLRSGTACADAVQDRFDVVRIDVDKSVVEKLRDAKPDVALNMLHGPFGEDGGMQAILEFLEIPYSHSGVLASALAMNKFRSREVFKAAGIPVAEGETVSRFDAAREHVMIPPYVLKPIANGSSVGVYIVKDGDEPPAEIGGNTWAFGDNVLAEKYIPGKELTCAVIGNRALDVIEITSDLAFYDYQAKYAPGASRHVLPAPISKDVYVRVQAYALSAHNALGCRGVSRSDFRYDDATGTLVCLETNTQPGMTATSLVPEMAAYAGIPFPDLVTWMIDDASLHP